MYCRYSPVEPAIAPPKRYVNIRRNITGVIGHVEQLLGDVLDLEHPAPAEGHRRGERGSPARRSRASSASAWRRSRRRASSCRRLLDAPRPSGSAPRRVAGEREEHLVQARLAEREVGDARCPPRRAPPPRSRAAVGVRARRGERRRVGLEVHVAPSSRRSTLPRPSGRCSGSSSRTCSAPRADRRLELPRRALGDHRAVVDDRDAVGELVGLVEVLGAEQDRRARLLRARGRCPRPGCATRGSRPVVGSSRNISSRRDDDARRDVQPPAHAARVVLDQARRRPRRGRTRRAARPRGPSPRRGAGRAGGRAG